MFKHLESVHANKITINVDGIDIDAPEGVTVAAAMLSIMPDKYRTTRISGVARAPYCMMGVCFECLIEIDGVADQQACLIHIKPGMVICRQINPQQKHD